MHVDRAFTSLVAVPAVAMLLTWPAGASAQTAGAAATSDVPHVTFAVTPLFDGPCERLSGSPRDTAAARELRERVGEFRSLWTNEGPPLLRATVELTGRPFVFGETVAALHTCSELGNLSLPLSLSMRRYMRTQPAGALADSLHRFVPVVFHEILHRHVVDLLGDEPSTPLWRRYANEPERVRWHLHLMAIENAVYERTGRLRQLASLRTERNRWPSYARAQEIVDAEGVEAFLAELRTGRASAATSGGSSYAGSAEMLPSASSAVRGRAGAAGSQPCDAVTRHTRALILPRAVRAP